MARMTVARLDRIVEQLQKEVAALEGKIGNSTANASWRGTRTAQNLSGRITENAAAIERLADQVAEFSRETGGAIQDLRRDVGAPGVLVRFWRWLGRMWCF